MKTSTFFYNIRLVDANTDEKGALLVQEGKIAKILFENSQTDKNEIDQLKLIVDKKNLIDGKQKIIMPSFIDMHVHLRNPGQEQKETIESFLKAAVAGGYGTLVAMPNTNPVVSDRALAKSIQNEVAKYDKANVIQSISITRNFDGIDISEIKSLPPSTDENSIPLITEDGKDVASANVLLSAMKEVTKKNIIVSCHSEDASLTEPAKILRAEAVELLKNYPAKDWTNLSSENCTVDLQKVDELFFTANNYLALAENIATERNITLAKHAQCRIHLAHVSTKNVIEMIKRRKNELKAQKNEFFLLSCEVTPHHFALCADDKGFLRYIVNPPIRGDKDKQALIEAIIDGTIDVIATDHAPHTKTDKQNGSPGFSGLETAFSVSYTELVQKKRIPLQKLSSLMSGNPAKLLHLSQKGLLSVGKDADLVLIDPDTTWTVTSKNFFTGGSVCPFEGKTLQGKVVQTWFKGKLVFNLADI